MKKLTQTQTQRQRGLTLIELLVSLAVAAIVATLAVPSFRSVIENNRITTINDKMLASLRLARSEAIARGRSVTVCPSNDQTTCSGTWSDGWILFVDEDGDRVLDGGTDEVVKANDMTASDYGITLISGIATSFKYDNEGRAEEQGTFRVCGPSGESSRARGIVIQLSGSTRYAVDSDADTVREAHEGTNFSC